MLVFTNPDRFFALLRVQQGYGWHMHDGYMFGGFWGAGILIHVVLWLLVVAAIVLATLYFAKGPGGGSDKGGGGSSALDQLDERYARGEIDREEYLQRKKDIIER